ncbi:Hypothetical protein R9X50_00346900 [Acrodontium crateriforme]|uniref:Carboxypeptidase n=1 Tax=Acrodontium crateriforme TaxID=150365 RepID=A0AAQ3M3F7_9PEZI|nr:Hypothetical protein R9X50_00346900 [Acrodontium crateriforme]
MKWPILVASAFAYLVAAVPTLDRRYTEERDGKTYNVFEHAATGAKMSFVKNSGICETTKGYSGYLSVGNNMNMFFWFFEARHNPKTAPLAMWLNGGPGCSSLIGLFQENGPCHFRPGATEPILNRYSWNTYANMLYVDQPIGTGFSYGDDTTDSTLTAAPYVWTLLQAFYSHFPHYKNRDFGIFTESYGGHYGPEFTYFFEQQNAGIADGTVKGHKIPIVALGINNGWVDSRIQYPAYAKYAATNKYRKLLTEDQVSKYAQVYHDDCLPLLTNCTGDTGHDVTCEIAENDCYTYIAGDIAGLADFDVYDIRQPSNDPYPPSQFVDYLHRSDVVSAIGAQGEFSMCHGTSFEYTGDSSRSYLKTLSKVVESGIQVALSAGDADYICNYIGCFEVANALSWSKATHFKNKPLANYTIEGKVVGLYKNVDNLSWLQFYEAGHEVPYYLPRAAFQYFNQTMSKKPLSPSHEYIPF